MHCQSGAKISRTMKTKGTPAEEYQTSEEVSPYRMVHLNQAVVRGVCQISKRYFGIRRRSSSRWVADIQGHYHWDKGMDRHIRHSWGSLWWGSLYAERLNRSQNFFCPSERYFPECSSAFSSRITSLRCDCPLGESNMTRSYKSTRNISSHMHGRECTTGIENWPWRHRGGQISQHARRLQDLCLILFSCYWCGLDPT